MALHWAENHPNKVFTRNTQQNITFIFLFRPLVIPRWKKLTFLRWLWPSLKQCSKTTAVLKVSFVKCFNKTLPNKSAIVESNVDCGFNDVWSVMKPGKVQNDQVLSVLNVHSIVDHQSRKFWFTVGAIQQAMILVSLPRQLLAFATFIIYRVNWRLLD